MTQNANQSAHHWDARSAEEELSNAFTHALGLAAAVYGAARMVGGLYGAPTGRMAACGVYLATLLAVFTVSTLSHAVRRPKEKYTLKVIDQGVIYLLIAGTYTPLMWAHIPVAGRWVALALVWAAAAAGVASKMIAQHRVTNFSTASYLLLGWVPAAALAPFTPWTCLGLILGGGLSYSGGTYFLMNDRRHRHFHAIWHIFVIIGAGLHFIAVDQFVVRA